MGYLKNNRRTRKVKVTRKVRNSSKFKTRYVGDEKLRKSWDHTKTTKQNYEILGLVADPNEKVDLKKNEVCSLQVYDIPDSDIMNNSNPNKKPNHMSEDEIKYLRPLVEKYKEDYEKMFRDIKMNNMQWTESKLRRRCARMRLLECDLITK